MKAARTGSWVPAWGSSAHAVAEISKKAQSFCLMVGAISNIWSFSDYASIYPILTFQMQTPHPETQNDAHPPLTLYGGRRW